VETPKVTQEMIDGKKKPPAGFELRVVKHDEYTYTHPASGKKVTVKAHVEHVLAAIKKPDSKKVATKDAPKKVASKKDVVKPKAKVPEKPLEG